MGVSHGYYFCRKTGWMPILRYAAVFPTSASYPAFGWNTGWLLSRQPSEKSSGGITTHLLLNLWQVVFLHHLTPRPATDGRWLLPSRTKILTGN